MKKRPIADFCFDCGKIIVKTGKDFALTYKKKPVMKLCSECAKDLFQRFFLKP